MCVCMCVYVCGCVQIHERYIQHNHERLQIGSDAGVSTLGLKRIVRIFANIRISLNRTNIFRGSNIRQ